MKSAYQIIRRPVITEKGLAIKENQNTWCLSLIHI